MAGFNRGRYVFVSTNGWSEYQRRLPHANMLGVITVNGETGALIRRHCDGIYCMANRGRMRTLVADKVEAAMDAARSQQGYF